MNLPLVLFYIFGAASLLAAVGVVTSRNVVHSALFLIFSLLTVAGIFILLLADFLALVQILLYAGAVAILVLFGLMLTRIREHPNALDNPQKPAAIIAGLAFLGVLIYAIYQTNWPAQAVLRRVPLNEIGNSLFSQWAMPFEIASLVLLVALIGGIIIARSEDTK